MNRLFLSSVLFALGLTCLILGYIHESLAAMFIGAVLVALFGSDLINIFKENMKT